MKKKCPIVKEECWEHACEFYTHLLGQNPQTGAQEDQWGCAVNFLPILLIENAQMTRHSTASADKIASEVRSHHASFLDVLNQKVKPRLMDADIPVDKLASPGA